MARLISPPVGLRPNRWMPLGGPETVGAASTVSIGGATQDVSSPFGLVARQYEFPPIRGEMARRVRGWITAMHKGANATRWKVCDWDGLSFEQRHIVTTSAKWRQGVPWSNGQPWGNGQNWHPGSPTVAVAEEATKGETIVQLSNSTWGHDLDVGDWFGFYPFHFGLYEITERIHPGEYRIWPPLRKDLTLDTFATLYPTMAMKLMRTNLPEASRGPAFVEGLSISLIEVPDYEARTYFTD